MAGLCSTNCGAISAPPAAYDDLCNEGRAFANGEHFFLVQCDQAIDINDATAVEAAIASGAIQASPRGRLVRNAGTDITIDDVYGCGEDVVVLTETPIDFTTINATCDSTADNVYWKNINDNPGLYRLFWVDCCGKIHYQLSGDNPGFRFSLTTKFTFLDTGTEGIGNWVGQFTIDHTTDIDAIYNPAVVTALGISI